MVKFTGFLLSALLSPIFFLSLEASKFYEDLQDQIGELNSHQPLVKPKSQENPKLSTSSEPLKTEDDQEQILKCRKIIEDFESKTDGNPTQIEQTKYAHAHGMLARIYHLSNVVSLQDPAKALTHYILAAQNGDKSVKNTIIVLIESNRTLSKLDLDKQIDFLQKAAGLNYSIAQRRLGQYYKEGFGVPKDISKAANWYNKAIQNGDEEAQSFLDKLNSYFEFKAEIGKDPSKLNLKDLKVKDLIAQSNKAFDENKALANLETDKGPRSNKEIDEDLLNNNTKVTNNLFTVLYCYEHNLYEILQEDYAQIHLTLGKHYLNYLRHVNSKQRSTVANDFVYHFDRAGENGETEGYTNNAQLYLHSNTEHEIGVNYTPQKALEYLFKAAAQGSSYAAYKIAKYYETLVFEKRMKHGEAESDEGNNDEKNRKIARKWYEKVLTTAGQNPQNGEAQFYAAEIYRSSNYKNESKANKCAKQAEAQGCQGVEKLDLFEYHNRN